MGLMRLFVHDSQRMEGVELSRIYMMGFDEIPWYCHVFFSDSQLVIQRTEGDSGSVCVPWKVAGRGEMLISTATLMEREEPYFLEVELARGVVNRVRNQKAGWELLGLDVSESVHQEVAKATSAFARAASRQHDRDAALAAAVEAIELGVAAAESLAAAYSKQAMQMRLAPNGHLNTLLGARMATELDDQNVRKSFVETFNLVGIPMDWQSVEASEGQRNWKATDEHLRWARESDLKIVAGPLLEFDERRVPDWTYLWEGDYDTLSSFMKEHVRNTVLRYKGKVNLWHLASRINRSRVLSLSEEDRLHIVAESIQTVREIDNRTPIVVSFDQPWAEYMGSQQVDLAPIHFADALVRSDLGLSGIGLELNIGHQPRATEPRTVLSISRLIDQWSLFDLPLFVMLTVGTKTSKQMQQDDSDDEVARLQRAEWIERNLPVITSKNCVQVVLWNQLLDHQAEFPHAGLFDESNHPKPALEVLKKFRKDYLA